MKRGPWTAPSSGLGQRPARPPGLCPAPARWEGVAPHHPSLLIPAAPVHSRQNLNLLDTSIHRTARLPFGGSVCTSVLSAHGDTHAPNWGCTPLLRAFSESGATGADRHRGGFPVHPPPQISYVHVHPVDGRESLTLCPEGLLGGLDSAESHQSPGGAPGAPPPAPRWTQGSDGSVATTTPSMQRPAWWVEAEGPVRTVAVGLPHSCPHIILLFGALGWYISACMCRCVNVHVCVHLCVPV